MENYEEIYKTICRICLKYGNKQNMISLIDINAQDGLSCHGKAVLTFANIRFENQDCLPVAMCAKCLYLLKQAIYFKFLCESSDKCLRKLLNIVGNSCESIQEKIVEYTLFRLYFPEIDKIPETSRNNNTKKTEMLKNKSSINIELPIEPQTTNDIQTEEFLHNQSDSDQNTNNGDEILNKLQRIINSSITSDITISKPIKRKYLKFKNKRAKRKKIAASKNIIKQRKVENLICNICNKVLANQLTYEHHMQRHNGCRYICEQCGKGFPVRTELNIHQVTRHGTGPYLQCSHCPFKAPRKFDLTEHERLHTGERPYACEKCGLTFRRRGIWRKHLIYHNEKKVQCPQCPRKFFQRSEMLAHANNIHDRMYMYLCNKCGATYAKTATVRRHMTERHAIPREMQGKIIRIHKGVGYQEP